MDVQKGRWLDVLPLTGLYTEEIASRYPDVDLTFAEMTDQVFEFVRDRAPRPLRPRALPRRLPRGPRGLRRHVADLPQWRATRAPNAAKS